MFKALRHVFPLARMNVTGMRQLSTRTSFMVPSCSNISSMRFDSYVRVLGPIDQPEKLTFKIVEERVIKAIRAWDRFPQDKSEKLIMEARFIEDLSLDSLDMVEVTMALEDEFGFELSEELVDKFKTPRDIYKFICDKEGLYE